MRATARRRPARNLRALPQPRKTRSSRASVPQPSHIHAGSPGFRDAALRCGVRPSTGVRCQRSPHVNAIAQQVKARIKQIEEELKKHQNLHDELERLRDALARLEGAARSRLSGARQPAGKPAGRPKRAGTATRASAPVRAPRGENKAKVLQALKDGPMTASEIAEATGIGTGTVSTMLTKMTKTGELAKADRGYTLRQ